MGSDGRGLAERAGGEPTGLRAAATQGDENYQKFRWTLGSQTVDEMRTAQQADVDAKATARVRAEAAAETQLTTFIANGRARAIPTRDLN